MKDLTELMKGLLEGMVLQIISRGETYGYAITNTLVKMGFEDIVEGTVYTVLIRLEKQKLISFTKKKSNKGPARKFYSLTEAGRTYLNNFWQKWNFVSNKMQEIREK